MSSIPQMVKEWYTIDVIEDAVFISRYMLEDAGFTEPMAPAIAAFNGGSPNSVLMYNSDTMEAVFAATGEHS